MAHRWNIAQAKACFSELVRDAAEQPQTIENRGREVAVVLGIDDYLLLVDQADRTSEVARVREFLRASAELRAQGGAEIELPARTERASPFAEAGASVRKTIPRR